MSHRTGVGIIGCGNISEVYARKLSALPFVDLVACADLLPERAKELAERNTIPKALDPDALVADDEVQVVVNLTIPRDARWGAGVE
jgi:predicted dehydrogenase